ncbi:hypothetical protein [Candidatus Poriferisocius sp.]|uniref:hypothetical protein n=1 Tax=Candidatus Poriferisocius sp. TaxID=3101276 RepID=UPI003B02A9BC
MHPIEHLRYVARSSGWGQESLVRETAGALLSFGHDPAGLVTACRSMIARRPSSGPLMWLAARVLTAADPRSEIRMCLREMTEDKTARFLALELPVEATVCVLGRPDLVGDTLRRRGDLHVLVVDVLGEGHHLVRRLSEQDGWVAEVAESGLGAAAASADVVLLESAAVGPGGFLAVSGSRAAAAVAHTTGVPVWLVAGRGAVLPAPMWDALVARTLAGVEPWEADREVVSLALADMVVGPEGLVTVAEAVGETDCPVVPELFCAAD